MKILHVVASLSPKWGGPFEIAIGMAQAIAKKGIKVSIYAPSEKEDGVYINNLKMVDVKLFSKSFFSKFWTSYSPSLAKTLRREITDFDLIHIQEIWHHPLFAAYKAAKFARKPFVVTIQGTLEPWCLNHKKFKKKIGSILFQRKILKEASGLHAVTEEEVKNIYEFVDNNNIFYIPNGINQEDFENLPFNEEFEYLYPELKGKKVLLFLGRIHPKKGLDMLAKAFGAILKKRDDIQLVIAGPDNNYKNQIVEILKVENAIGNTTFTGMLTGNNKLAALSRADIFVLPSYSEGFSISTLEAMACGLPILITKQCNFPEVEEIGAGKIIDADIGQLSKALLELLDNPELCKEMGKRGRSLVVEKYTWDKVADKMIDAYKEILGSHKVIMEAI
jgi:glycosyltransferase involved in cell wall biosynthesis